MHPRDAGCWSCSISCSSQDAFLTSSVKGSLSLFIRVGTSQITSRYPDDVVLLSPTEQGLQQQLDIAEKYCQNWALPVNMKKTNFVIFQKCPRCQENKYQFKSFTINNQIIQHSMSYTYLGITITASGSFNMAVNALKEKAWRALNAIKRKFYNFQIPIKIWLKIFDSVIQPIALYGSEVWGPLNHQSCTRWDKHPTESLHAEFCRYILHVQRKTPTNKCT